jgi:hypothetical protein
MAATGKDVLMHFRRTPALLTALISALLIAAGSAASIALASPSGASPIEQAANKTAKAGTFRVSYTVTVSAKGGTAGATLSKPVTLTGQGAFNTKHSTGQFSLNLGALGAALGAATGGISVPSTIDLVLLNNALYLHLPSLAQQVSPGKEWLKFDVTKLPKSATAGANVGQLAKQIDPQQALAALRAAVSVHKVGSDQVRGVATTHYKAVVDLLKVVAALPKAQQASSLKAIKQAGLTKLPLDAWIDGSGFLRRLALSTQAKSSGTTASVALMLDLYDYGAKIKVVAPPASKVADGTALLTALAATAGAGGNGTKPPTK